MPSVSPLSEGEGEGQAHQIEVTRFGQPEPLKVAPEDVLTFPEGLVGLDHLRLFVLLDDERVTPCRWLQSIDEPDLSFLVVDPRLVDPSYAPDLPGGELWSIISLRQPPEQSTANLLAPVVIDALGRTGRQVVLRDLGYSLRHPISSLGDDAVAADSPEAADDARTSA